MEFIVLDFETTGLSAVNDRIIEIGYALIQGGEITDVKGQLVNPGVPILNPKITELTGIDNAMLKDAPPLEQEMRALHDLLRGKLIVAHCAGFDMGFLNSTLYRMGLPTYHSYLCTMEMFRGYKKEHNIQVKGASLAAMTAYFSLQNERAHRAAADAHATAKAFLRMCEDSDYRGYMTGPTKRSKTANDPEKRTKRDKYMHLLDAHTPIEDICTQMKVKQSTVGKYMLEWMEYADPAPYRAYLTGILPNRQVANQIMQLRKSGLGTGEIFRQMNGTVDYFPIQLVGRLFSRRVLDQYIE